MSCYTPIDNLPLTGKTHLTDYSRWKLTYTDDGGHIWKYLSDEELQLNPQTTIEKFWLGLPLVRVNALSFNVVGVLIHRSRLGHETPDCC